MMTLDEVAVACGLQPFSTFSTRLAEFAAAYGCEPRHSGRTTRTLCLAIAQAREGKRVLLRYATVRLADDARRQAGALDERASADVEATDLVSEWGLQGATRLRIEFATGGVIEFASATERLLGQRHDSVLRDHYDSARPVDRTCLHRVERAKRRCDACGLKLRSRKVLKLARLRDRMRQADPETWRMLGLETREGAQRLTSAAPLARREPARTFRIGLPRF